jgi:hypothetical protein
MAVRYGAPSPARARAALDRFGAHTDEILASGSTHLIGDYFRTWPAAFHANVVRWERGETTPVWVISLRSGPTEPLWRPRDWSGAHIAVLPGDEAEAARMRQKYGLPGPDLAISSRP